MLLTSPKKTPPDKWDAQPGPNSQFKQTTTQLCQGLTYTQAEALPERKGCPLPGLHLHRLDP